MSQLFWTSTFTSLPVSSARRSSVPTLNIVLDIFVMATPTGTSDAPPTGAVP